MLRAAVMPMHGHSEPSPTGEDNAGHLVGRWARYKCSVAVSREHARTGYLATIIARMGPTLSEASPCSGLGWQSSALIRFVHIGFGGFLAITGWYLLVGGMDIVAGHHLNLQNLDSLFEPVTGIKMLLAIAFAGLVLLSARGPSGALLPVAVVATTAIFDIVVLLLGVSQMELAELVGSRAQRSSLYAFDMSDWRRLMGAVGRAARCAFVIMVTQRRPCK